MSKTEHALNIDLRLKWEHGDQYEATVNVETTDSCYKELALRAGLPPGTAGIPEIAYLTFEFSHEGERCGQIVRTVSKTHQVSSAGKREVTAFVVVNGTKAGHVTKGFPRREQ